MFIALGRSATEADAFYDRTCITRRLSFMEFVHSVQVWRVCSDRVTVNGWKSAWIITGLLNKWHVVVVRGNQDCDHPRIHNFCSRWSAINCESHNQDAYARNWICVCQIAETDSGASPQCSAPGLCWGLPSQDFLTLPSHLGRFRMQPFIVYIFTSWTYLCPYFTCC